MKELYPESAQTYSFNYIPPLIFSNAHVKSINHRGLVRYIIFWIDVTIIAPQAVHHVIEAVLQLLADEEHTHTHTYKHTQACHLKYLNL